MWKIKLWLADLSTQEAKAAWPQVCSQSGLCSEAYYQMKTKEWVIEIVLIVENSMIIPMGNSVIQVSETHF